MRAFSVIGLELIPDDLTFKKNEKLGEGDKTLDLEEGLFCLGVGVFVGTAEPGIGFLKGLQMRTPTTGREEEKRKKKKEEACRHSSDNLVWRRALCRRQIGS